MFSALHRQTSMSSLALMLPSVRLQLFIPTRLTKRTIGVASFVPLFLYTFFLYIYSDSELLPNALSLPRKLGKVACLLLLILIPAIVGSNEVASFVGIQRRKWATVLVVAIGSICLSSRYQPTRPSPNSHRFHHAEEFLRQCLLLFLIPRPRHSLPSNYIFDHCLSSDNGHLQSASVREPRSGCNPHDQRDRLVECWYETGSC